MRHLNRPLHHLKPSILALITLYGLATISFVLSVASITLSSEMYVEVLKGTARWDLGSGRTLLIIRYVAYPIVREKHKFTPSPFLVGPSI